MELAQERSLDLAQRFEAVTSLRERELVIAGCVTLALAGLESAAHHLAHMRGPAAAAALQRICGDARGAVLQAAQYALAQVEAHERMRRAQTRSTGA